MEDYSTKYPEKEFTKKTYTFTQSEIRELGFYDNTAKLGQLAQVMLGKLIAGEPLKRVGVKDSPDVGILYDMNKGEFYVYEPKFWCSMCKNKKASFQYNNLNYCPVCIEILKKSQPVKVEKKTKGGKK